MDADMREGIWRWRKWEGKDWRMRVGVMGVEVMDIDDAHITLAWRPFLRICERPHDVLPVD